MSEGTLELLRVFFIIPQIVLFYYFIKIYGFEKHLWYFTTWSLDLVIISIAFTIYLARFKDKQAGIIGLLGTALTEIAMVS